MNRPGGSSCRRRRAQLVLSPLLAAVVVAAVVIASVVTSDAGRLPPLDEARPNVTTQYDESLFGGWKQVDCITTRTRVLMIAATHGSLDRDRCSVLGGTWTDRWTGDVIDDPDQIEIDHTVPKKNAWRSGAWRWNEEKLHRYMNDLGTDHLVVMRDTTNASKGDSGPEDWKPEDESQWCEYARSWARIKHAWRLTATRDELHALETMASTC